MKLLVKDIVNICNGKLFCGDENIVCNSFTKDTRSLTKGDVYLGIKGTNFDGNTLYQEAFEKGACACILEENSFIKDDTYHYNKPIILVSNARKALKDLGVYIRNNSKAKFIGITGSVGKTSTKDMIYSTLSKSYKTLKTEGNYNNDLGVPLTLLRLSDEECAVIEMGMNNLGEIDYLTNIVKPHIAVITNVGTAHIGNLGSRENILKAKLEIKNGLVENGILIINNDNDLLHEYYLNNSKNILTIGINNESDIMAKDISIDNNGAKFNLVYKNNTYKVLCKVPSISFVYNSLVAFAVGTLLDMEPNKIILGIKDLTLTNNRLEFIDTPSNIHIINDCYNASVDSMKSSLDILKLSKKRKIACLGSMLELGEYSVKLHEEVGKYVADNKIDILITVGEDAKYIASSALKNGIKKENIFTFDTLTDAINKLNEILKPDDTLLVKASNALRFSEIVHSIKDI